MKHAKLYSDRRQSLGTSLFAFIIPHCRGRGNGGIGGGIEGGEGERDKGGGGWRERETERGGETDREADIDQEINRQKDRNIGNQREKGRERDRMEDSVKNIQEYTDTSMSSI